jgi:signal transduction histidine kinase
LFGLVGVLITVASERSRVVAAWDYLRVDPRGRLHLDLHPATPLMLGRALVLARLFGLIVIDFEVAVHPRRSGPIVLLVVLAVVANVGALVWLLGRWRRGSLPAVGLAVMGLAGGLLAALQHGSAALAFPAVAVAQTVADGSVLAAVAVGALALVALEAGVLLASLGPGAALGYPAVLLGSAMIGLTRRQYVAQSRAAEALVAQTRRTEAESRRAAALDERTRIAREIHDVLAHALGGLAVQLEAAELLLAERGDVDAALERIRASRGTAREGLEEARRAVAALRSDRSPLPERLAELVQSHREQGDRGELIVGGPARTLSPEVSLALMRTVQEALTNARRHAPGAAVQVRLFYEAASTTVIVTNDAAPRADGTPGDGVSGGYGLTGMRERLELVGGRLVAGPSPEGWTVRAEVPS